MKDDLQKAGEQKITMREASERLGVKSRVLRKYCNLGFVPGLTHCLPGQKRTFTDEQIDYLRQADFLTRAGFTAKDLRKYLMLSRKKGEVASKERKAMLMTHKRQVWQELEDLQRTIDFLERQEELL